MGTRMRMVVGTLVIVFGVGASALISYAADSRLDDAVAHLTKAKALVAAAVPPANAPKSYFQHTKRATDLIDQAIQQVALAKSAAGP